MTIDPIYLQAWNRLKACVDSGASIEEVTEYAQELARGLPDIRDPVACHQSLMAMLYVIEELEGEKYSEEQSRSLRDYWS